MNGLPNGATLEGDRPVALVAVEPRAYASVIGAVVGRLRPGLDVRVVEPEDLPTEVLRLSPFLVLCSQARERAGRDGGPVWVEFYPYAAVSKLRVHAGGRLSTREDVDLDGLLSIVDGEGLRFPSGARDAC